MSTPERFLIKSKNTLVKLREYLIAHGHLSENFPLPALVWSAEQDARNKEDRRAFCFVVRGRNEIHTTRELESIGLEFRIGILLHELGHMVLDAFDGDQSEVDVDAWCMNIPESGYTYADCSYYPSGKYNRIDASPVSAKNIEKVSAEFTREVMLNDNSGDY